MGREMLHAVDVNAVREAVYEAISTHEGLTSFWTPDVDAEPAVGSVARFGFEKAPMDLRMRIDALEPGRSVVWTCLGDFPYWNDTHVEWRIEPSPEGAGTRVTFGHTGWPEDQPEAEYALVNFTWGQIVARLREYLESGRREPYLH